jgi:hypothetical protein
MEMRVEFWGGCLQYLEHLPGRAGYHSAVIGGLAVRIVRIFVPL